MKRLCVSRILGVAVALGLAVQPILARATDPTDPDYTLLTGAVWTKVAAALTATLPAIGAVFAILLVVSIVMRKVKRASSA